MTTASTTRLPLNVDDYEPLARAAMATDAYDYYAGGASDEKTLAENRRAFDSIWITPRVLVDVTRVDTSVTVLGEKLAMPILLAPTAYHRLAHPEGEVATARGAGAAGALMVAATMGTRSLEEIAAAASGPLWFQLYVHKDRGITRHLLSRAEAAGYKALVLTIDTPVLGRRDRDTRNAFTLPEGMPAANFMAAYPGMAFPVGGAGGGTLRTQSLSHLDPSVTWKTLDELRSYTKMPLLLKGIIDPADAKLAIAAGVAGVIVSNHGGRQLDGAEASIRALPAVVEAVDGVLPVLVDGGIRRGTDVLKALALGARAVLIGRPFLWGLAARGEAGVQHVLELLRSELELAMALSGRTDVASIDRSLVRLG